MRTAKNPIVEGFYSDWSVVRVGGDYYAATSTFEWFPGVALLHSKDLEHWETLPSILQDDGLVDLRGLDSACAIWAPNLTWCDGLFYLAYTIVYTGRYRFKDTHNFLITSPSPTGPWSKPVFLNCSGFDPSIFHAEDGRKYLVNQTMEHRTRYPRFRGISVQEYDPVSQKLLGEPKIVFRGTERGTTEGPNLLKKGDWYYLTVAEGGTEFGHCVQVTRSKTIWGPFEPDPDGPMLSSSNQDWPLQRAGHGQFFQGSDGGWYLAHLCSRPIDGKWSVLGREAAIQNIVWNRDGWPRLDNEGASILPSLEFRLPETAPEIYPQPPALTLFSKGIPDEFVTLRQSWRHSGISLEERPGWLRIHGGNSLSSRYFQGLLAHRITKLHCAVSTKMQFSPRNINHMAGLLCYYNNDNYHYLVMSRGENGIPTLTITTCENGTVEDVFVFSIAEGIVEIWLKAEIDGKKLQFSYSLDGQDYQASGPVLDMTLLSDEHVNGNGFTGAMAGICCQDLQGDGVFADFEWFCYE